MFRAKDIKKLSSEHSTGNLHVYNICTWVNLKYKIYTQETYSLCLLAAKKRMGFL